MGKCGEIGTDLIFLWFVPFFDLTNVLLFGFGEFDFHKVILLTWVTRGTNVGQGSVAIVVGRLRRGR